MRCSSLASILLVSALALAALPCPLAEARGKEEKREGLPTPPPLPVPGTLQVLRRGTVEVPLKIYGSQRDTVRFLIRSAPEAGELSNPQVTSKESATVTYTPPADTTFRAVRFTYAAQTSAGVSAPAEVTISIIDEPAQLISPAELNFGKVLAGTTATQELELENRGGLVTEGTLEVDAPWRVEGSPTYRLEPQGRQRFTLTFAPTAGGTYRREARFTSQVDRVTSLYGQADDVIALSEKAVRLSQTAGDPIRSGTVLVKNHTAQEQELRFRGTGRLALPERLVVPAGATVPLTLRTVPGEVAPLREQLVLSGAGIETTLTVEADTVAPTLHAAHERTSFAPGATEAGGYAQIMVQNIGGAEGFWRCEVPAPFTVSPPEARIPAGGQQNFTVQYANLPPGPARTVVKFAGEQHTVNVLVEGQIAPSLGTSMAPSSSGSSAPRRSSPASSSGTAPRPALASTQRPRSSGAEAEADTFSGDLLDYLIGGRKPATAPVGKDIKVASVGARHVVFVWPEALDKQQSPRVQFQTVALDAAKQLQVTWKEVPYEVKARGDGFTEAKVGDLQAATPYVYRILPRNSGAAMFRGQFTTTSLTAWQRSWPWAAGAAALAAGAYLAWQQWRRRQSKAPSRA